jgi:hypothetical protein
MSHPGSWTPNLLRIAIDYMWNNAGFNGTREVTPHSCETKLSDEAQKTLDHFLAGETVKDILPAYTFTRHRQSILKNGGPDIAIPLRQNRIKPESIGYQLQYARRWEPKGRLRKFVLCEETAPDIITDLKQGIDYLESGVLPDALDGITLEAWLKRWKNFSERQMVHK